MRRRLAGFRAGRSLQPVLIAAAALVALATLTHSVWLQVVACGLLGLVASSALSLGFGTGCEVTLSHPNDLVVATAAEVCFTVRNPGSRRSRPLLLSYQLVASRPLAPTVTVYLDSVAPGGQVEARATLTPLARGEATCARWSVTQLGAFGLFSVKPVRTLERRVAVAPQPATPVALRAPGGAREGAGPVRSGLDVRGVREWRPGDPARRVHWRATARTGELRVLERGEPSHPALGVLFAGRAGDPRFETVLARTAATVALALEDGAECHAWLEQPGAGCFGRLTPSSSVTPFVRVEAAELPSDKGISHLLDHVGAGGLLLLAIADDVPQAWSEQVRAVAASSGLDVVDMREFP
ncbi:MAG TPA: DUF58 domain-containing protein [Acidothermaceae bacterium]